MTSLQNCIFHTSCTLSNNTGKLVQNKQWAQEALRMKTGKIGGNGN